MDFLAKIKDFFRIGPPVRRAEDPRTGDPIPYPWHAKVRDRLQSRVVQGVVVTLLGLALSKMGFHPSNELLREVFPLLDQLLGALPELLQMYGAWRAYVGRVKATKVYQADGPPIEVGSLLPSFTDATALLPQSGPTRLAESDTPSDTPAPPPWWKIQPRPSCLRHPSALARPRNTLSPESVGDGGGNGAPGGMQAVPAPLSALPVDLAARDVVVISSPFTVVRPEGAKNGPIIGRGSPAVPQGGKLEAFSTAAPAGGPAPVTDRGGEAGITSLSNEESFDAAWLGIIRRRAELQAIPLEDMLWAAGEYRADGGTLGGLAQHLTLVCTKAPAPF